MVDCPLSFLEGIFLSSIGEPSMYGKDAQDRQDHILGTTSRKTTPTMIDQAENSIAGRLGDTSNAPCNHENAVQ